MEGSQYPELQRDHQAQIPAVNILQASLQESGITNQLEGNLN